MLAWILLLAPATTQDPSTAELRRLAEDHVKAEHYVDAAETYLKLARRPDVRLRDELYNAHMHFENAFLVGGGAQHLCRALRLAERVLADDVFDDEQERLFWREVADFDLAELAEDARSSGRPNCRFDAAGRQRAPVLLLTDADFPRKADPAPAPAPTPAPPRPNVRPPGRGLLITGGVLLGTAAALGGVATAAFVQRDAHVDQERALAAQATALGYADTATLTMQARLADDIRAAHRLMLGAGIASGITAGTAAVLLTLGAHRRFAPRLDVQPTLGGLLLHGRF